MAPSAAFIPFPSVCAASRQQVGQLLSRLIRVSGELETEFASRAGFISMETTSQMKGETKRLMKTEAAASRPRSDHLTSEGPAATGEDRGNEQATGGGAQTSCRGEGAVRVTARGGRFG